MNFGRLNLLQPVWVQVLVFIQEGIQEDLIKFSMESRFHHMKGQSTHWESPAMLQGKLHSTLRGQLLEGNSILVDIEYFLFPCPLWQILGLSWHQRQNEHGSVNFKFTILTWSCVIAGIQVAVTLKVFGKCLVQVGKLSFHHAEMKGIELCEVLVGIQHRWAIG